MKRQFSDFWSLILKFGIRHINGIYRFNILLELLQTHDKQWREYVDGHTGGAPMKVRDTVSPAKEYKSDA